MSTLRDKNGTVRTFNSQGFITAITDRNGNTVTIVRNGAQIQQIIEPGAGPSRSNMAGAASARSPIRWAGPSPIPMKACRRPMGRSGCAA